MGGTSPFRPIAGLSDRLKISARDQNIETQTLRSRYFRQRFFARLSQHYPDQWVLTGATALELRSNTPRATSDLDTVTTLALNDLGTAVSALGDDPEDPFTYQVKIPKHMQATTGVQAKVTVMLDGKRIQAFSMDIEHSRASGTPPEEMNLQPVVITDTAADSSARMVLLQSWVAVGRISGHGHFLRSALSSRRDPVGSALVLPLRGVLPRPGRDAH